MKVHVRALPQPATAFLWTKATAKAEDCVCLEGDKLDASGKTVAFGYIYSKNGRLTVDDGDYVVDFGDGTHEVMKADEFAQRCEKVTTK